MAAPRGIRNNNPTNISYGTFAKKYGADRIESPPLDGSAPRFAHFPTMVDGLRAAAELLMVYAVTDDGKGGKIDTVEEAINRWAPSSENHTAAYVALVCTVLGCNKDDEFDFSDPDFLYWMITGIGEEEVGPKAFNDAVTDVMLHAAISLALEN